MVKLFSISKSAYLTVDELSKLAMLNKFLEEGLENKI